VVLVPQPSYPLFEQLTALDGVRAVPYALRLGPDGWELPVDDLAARLPADARAVLVVHPNNPTGSRVADADARQLARLAAERGLALISDEVFAEFPWKGAPPRPHGLLDLAAREGCLVASLSGLSKACGLPQVKLAWLALDGPRHLVEEALARLDLAADAYLSVGTPVQLAAPALLAAGDTWRSRALARIEDARDAVAETVAGTGLAVLPGDGGWSAVLRLPDDRAEDDVLEALAREDGVLLQPGWLYDLGGDHAVVGLLTEPAILRRGLALLVARLGSA
jgi:aspartate/methionine/tyrosine aminotransferase